MNPPPTSDGGGQVGYPMAHGGLAGAPPRWVCVPTGRTPAPEVTRRWRAAPTATTPNHPTSTTPTPRWADPSSAGKPAPDGSHRPGPQRNRPPGHQHLCGDVRAQRWGRGKEVAEWTDPPGRAGDPDLGLVLEGQSPARSPPERGYGTRRQTPRGGRRPAPRRSEVTDASTNPQRGRRPAPRRSEVTDTSTNPQRGAAGPLPAGARLRTRRPPHASAAVEGGA